MPCVDAALLRSKLDKLTTRLLLTTLGNLCSSAVDQNAALSRTHFGSYGIIRCLQPYLSARDRPTQLYATAAMQNLCISVEVCSVILVITMHDVV